MSSRGLVILLLINAIITIAVWYQLYSIKRDITGAITNLDNAVKLLEALKNQAGSVGAGIKSIFNK